MTNFSQQLNTLREGIDELDTQLVELLAKRNKITTEVGKIKAQAGMAVYVPEREKALIASRRAQAESLGVSADLTEDLLRRVMRESYHTQNNNYRCVNPNIDNVVVIGGAMANTFLKAQGIEVGDSLVDDDELDTAHDIVEKVRQVCATRRLIFYLPQDGIVARKVDKGAKTRIVDWDAHVIASVEAYPKKPSVSATKIRKDEKILDIGPFSSAFISGAMQLCQTVVWNGTMGVSEIESVNDTVGPFAHGTEAVIDSLVGKYGNKPFSLLGGGDTTAYVDRRGMNDMFNHVSTGGGASLELMAGKELPGVTVLWGN